MKKGFDTEMNLTKFAAAIHTEGYDFVCRYYNINNPAKNLTLAEAHILSSVGLQIVPIWENGYPTSDAYFTYSNGVHDGTCAYHYAQMEITQPSFTPIYFSVDYDASVSAITNNIIPYCRGIQAAFSTISQNSPLYSIGVYGSGLVCTELLNAGIAEFTWLAQSIGYQGSEAFKASGKANIVQSLCTEFVSPAGNFGIDPDGSPNDNTGSFTVNVIPAV